MNRYNQNLKKISVLWIFLFLIHISGCVSSKVTTSYSDLPESGGYIYMINTQKSKYLVENIIISDGILSGKINANESFHLSKKIKLYLANDSSIKISSNMIISFPIKDISKVEIIKYSAGKTIVLAAGSIITLILVIGIISFITTPSIGL
jgi:hypothetical protein